MKKPWVLPVAGLIVLIGTFTALGLTDNQSVAPALTDVRAQNEFKPAGTLHSDILTQTHGESPLPPLPPELQGLEPDIRLSTDAEGNLVPTRDLRVLLDFYLANIDQEPLATALARIRAALSQRLKEPAMSQALSLLERYVGYRIALDHLQHELASGVTKTGFDVNVLLQRQEQLERVQHEYFDRDEKTAFFREETELDSYTLAKLAIEQNSSLTDSEKQQQIAQLTQQLPETIRVARKRAVIHGDLFQKVEAMKADNASDADLYQLRAKELGEDAAVKLAQLDQQQQQWQQRLSDYQQQKSRILEAGLSESDQIIAVTRLRERLFEGPERLRVRALDGD